MSNQYPRPRKPIPLLLWALLGFVVVLGFMFTLRVLNPPSAGMAPPQGYVIVPDQTVPKAPTPDAKPVS